jgi:hypothetical protein
MRLTWLRSGAEAIFRLLVWLAVAVRCGAARTAQESGVRGM